MDGWRFRQEQQRLAEQQLAGVPVVVFSALSDCQRHAQDLGAVDVTPKPIDFDRMLAVVLEYCRYGSDERTVSCRSDVRRLTQRWT